MSFSMGIPSLGGAVVGPATALTGPASAAPEPNANLFLWSEQMQQAIWTVGGGSVTVNADAGLNPAGDENTADELIFGGTGAVIGQTSSTAATTGAAVVATVSLSSSYVRRTISGSFDGTTYVLSVYLREPAGGGSELQIRLERSGGFVRGGLRDLGDSPTVHAHGWKLETPDLTAYVKREGA